MGKVDDRDPPVGVGVRVGLGEDEIDALLRRVSELPEDELDDKVSQLVDLIASDAETERPQRTRKPLPSVLLEAEQDAATS